MARTLTSPHGTAIAQSIVTPIWFVEIGFSSILRLTSGPTVTWNSLTWTEAKLDVKGFRFDGSVAQNVTIDIADPLEAYAALCVSQKLTQRAIKVWMADSSALDAGDPVLMPPLVGTNYALPRDYQVQISANVATALTLPSGNWGTLLPDVLFINQEMELRWGSGTLRIIPRAENK
jgi:hypothetical protein